MKKPRQNTPRMFGSLGVENANGQFCPVILKDTCLPCRAEIDIEPIVLEGEADLSEGEFIAWVPLIYKDAVGHSVSLGNMALKHWPNDGRLLSLHAQVDEFRILTLTVRDSQNQSVTKSVQIMLEAPALSET